MYNKDLLNWAQGQFNLHKGDIDRQTKFAAIIATCLQTRAIEAGNVARS